MSDDDEKIEDETPEETEPVEEEVLPVEEVPEEEIEDDGPTEEELAAERALNERRQEVVQSLVPLIVEALDEVQLGFSMVGFKFGGDGPDFYLSNTSPEASIFVMKQQILSLELEAENEAAGEPT